MKSVMADEMIDQSAAIYDILTEIPYDIIIGHDSSEELSHLQIVVLTSKIL